MEEFNIDLDNLNITSVDLNFDEIDDDLERFQEDEMVQQALHRGVDLKKYGRDLEKELKEVCCIGTFNFLIWAYVLFLLLGGI